MSNIDFGQVISAEARAAARLETARRTAEQALLSALDHHALSLTGEVPLSERMSWSVKEQAARAVLAGASQASDVAILQAEADHTGESVTALAERVVAKAEAYRVIAGRIAGLRRHFMGRIGQADSPEAVAAAQGALMAQLASDEGV